MTLTLLPTLLDGWSWHIREKETPFFPLSLPPSVVTHLTSSELTCLPAAVKPPAHLPCVSVTTVIPILAANVERQRSFQKLNRRRFRVNLTRILPKEACVCIKGYCRCHAGVWTELRGGEGICCDLSASGMFWKPKSGWWRDASWNDNRRWVSRLPSGVAQTAPGWHVDGRTSRSALSLSRVCSTRALGAGRLSFFMELMDSNNLRY